MNQSIFSLLVRGGLIFSIVMMGQSVKAQGFSYPAEMNKSFTPLSIEPGGRSRLEVTIFNPNSFELTNASWTDNLTAVQPGMMIANPANIANTCDGTVSAAPGGTRLSLSGGTVPEQVGSDPGSCTVSVDVTSFTPGNLINTIPIGALASTGSQGPVTNTTPASATLHVDIVEAPSLSKSFSPNTVLVGQTSRLTIRIRNNDLDLTLTQASLTDELPGGVTLANPVSPSLSGCGNTASLDASPADSSVTLSNATIAPNSTCTIQVTVISTISGIYLNTIPPDSLDTEQGLSNASSATATLNVQDIGLSKAFSPPSFQAGGTSTLTITLRNPTSSAFTGVELPDTLPGDVLTIVPGSASTTCGGSVSISPPRTVTLTDGTVPPGTPSSPGTCTITVQVTTPSNASADTFTNTIPPETLVTDQGITNGLGASARVSVYNVGGGISANKSFSPSTILAGENSRLRINITAPADTDLNNFSIVDNLPPNVTISNSSPATHNNCGDSAALSAETGATSITLTNGTIAAGTTCQITVYVTSSTAGVHTNVISPSDITNSENRTISNDISANLTVRVTSDISMSKSFTPPSVSPGGISTLRIILQNTNDSPIVNVSITDPLPGSATNGIIVAPNPNTSTTCAGGAVSAVPGTQTISMNGGTIPAQVADVPGTCTIRVDVQGMGSQTTRTNTIPADNLTGTIEGTGTTITPEQPARADLVIRNLTIGVVKGFDPLTVFGGSASTLSIELVNPNNVPMEGIAFTDSMPDGMIVANPVNPSVGECGGTLDATPGASSFSFSGGSLAASTSCTLTLRVTMNVSGNLTNTIESNAVTTLSGAVNPDPAEASLTNLPGASISKAFSPNPVRAGSVSLLTFTIQNTGSVPLSGMGFQDDLPGDLPVGVVIANSPAPVNNCGGDLTAVAGTQLIRLTDGALDAGASCTITVPVVGNIQGNFTNTIDAGSLNSNQGATNHDPTTDTLVVTGGSGSVNRPREGRPGTDDTAVPSAAVSGFLIPVTGYRPGSTTFLNEETRPNYDALNLRIEIPVIRVDTSIVGVQIKDGSWDVAWLQDQAGWLNGSAYPTWTGNSVVTAHVVNADGKPGIFSNLKYLGRGEYIFVYSSGYRFTYQVISNQAVQPDDVSIFGHKNDTYLTLITCEAFDETSGSYRLRIAVQARLVQVKAIQ